MMTETTTRGTRDGGTTIRTETAEITQATTPETTAITMTTGTTATTVRVVTVVTIEISETERLVAQSPTETIDDRRPAVMSGHRRLINSW